MTRASIIIVNYNGAAHLRGCLASIRSQSVAPFEIVVVDNHSTDGSLEMMGDFPEATLIQSGENLGFSRAVNIAARSARGEVLVLLNNDAEADRRFIEFGLQAMTDAGAAAAAAKILFYDRRNVINGVGGGMNCLGYAWDRGLNELDRGQYDRAEEVFFASGGACFIRRDAFLALDGFDERFFMYHEDVDFCWRARLAGWKVITCPAAVAYHRYGATTRREMGWDRREILGERHNLRSLMKNYELLNALLAWARILVLPLPRRRKWLQLENFAVNLLWLPDTLRQRFRIQRSRTVADIDLRRVILQSSAVPVMDAVPDAGSAAAAV